MKNDRIRARFSSARRTLSAFAAAAVSISAALPISATAANVTPYICASTAGYMFDVTANRGLILDGVGSPTIFRNGTASAATLSLSQTGAGTVEWTVNGSVSGTSGLDFEVIKSAVTWSIGGSFARSKYSSQTVSVQITVPAGKYGILQSGVFRRSVTGRYYFDYGNCTYSAGTIIDSKLPVNAVGYAATTNTTGLVPWDQQ